MSSRDRAQRSNVPMPNLWNNMVGSHVIENENNSALPVYFSATPGNLINKLIGRINRLGFC